MDWARKKAKELIAQMTIKEQIGLLSTTQTPIERLGVGAYNIGGEIAHGVVDREKIQTTSFPTALGLSQTWNPTLLKRVGTAMSDEARILYQQNPTGWLTPWAPTIDMERDPYWGRNEEGYGEDPHLTGQLAVALIQGLQGNDEKYLKLAAAPKHFYANNNEAGRESTSNTVDLKNKYNYYLRPFEQAFKGAKAQSMMTAYNGINGVPMMQSPDLLEVVKGEWQMDGFIVTDGGALTLNIENYHYYTDYADAVADALKKGIDCFVDEPALVETAAQQALDSGRLSAAMIIRAVENTLTVRARLGQFDSETPFDKLPKTLLGGDQHDRLAKECLAEGSVLLKNDNLLPLKTTETVLLTGPSANRYPRDWYAGLPMNRITVAEAAIKADFSKKMSYQASGEKVKIQTNHGFVEIAANGDAIEGQQGAVFELEDWGFGKGFLREINSHRYLVLADDGHYRLNKTEVYDWFAKETFNLVPTLKSYFNHNLAIVDGVLCESKNEQQSIALQSVAVLTDQVVENAAAFDKVVYIGGNHPMLNGRETQDRPGLALPAQQVAEIKQLHRINPNLVVIILGGYPFTIDELQKEIPGIMFVTYGGQSLGTGLLEILYGIKKPTGRLSQTWYNQAWNDPGILEYDIEKAHKTYQFCSDQAILYPFGYGLDYAGHLKLTNCGIQPVSWSSGCPAQVVVTVENQQSQAVTEVVQVYANTRTELGTSQKLLLGFKKITVASGQCERITIAIDVAILERYDVVTKKNILNEKEITLEVGFSAADKDALKQNVRIDGPKWRTSRLFDENFDVLAFDDYQAITIDSSKNEGSLVQIKESGYLKYCQMIGTKNGVQLAIKATQPGTLTISDDLEQTNIIARFSYQAGVEFQTVISEIKNTKECCDWVVQATTAVALRRMQPKAL